jgi:hypothetical protein
MCAIRLFRWFGLWPVLVVLIVPAALDSCSTLKPGSAIEVSAPQPAATTALHASGAPGPSASLPTPQDPPQANKDSEGSMSGEQVTFYPTYGYKDRETWRIPMRLWVHRERRHLDKFVARLVRHSGPHNPKERTNFRDRIADLFADGEGSEEVFFTFDNDPDGQRYRVIGNRGELRTDSNGVIEGTATLPAPKASKLLTLQKSHNGWLTLHAEPGGPEGEGRIQLIEPQGLSVISDIDDTIKITEIPAGLKVVLENTVFCDFEAVPGMAERYRETANASFHYVSGGPWQLYHPEAQFLVGFAGFPEGSFHLKAVSAKPLVHETWQGLEDLLKASFLGKEVTRQFKLARIRELMKQFPVRKFVLYGDSGECDPEVYREIRQEFPANIQEIWIRDVVNAQQDTPKRLEGMKPIPAHDERKSKDYIPCPAR